jgi:hypothetical protein
MIVGLSLSEMVVMLSHEAIEPYSFLGIRYAIEPAPCPALALRSTVEETLDQRARLLSLVIRAVRGKAEEDRSEVHGHFPRIRCCMLWSASVNARQFPRVDDGGTRQILAEA